jgi:predicted nicotinamide N-methyase
MELVRGTRACWEDAARDEARGALARARETAENEDVRILIDEVIAVCVDVEAKIERVRTYRFGQGTRVSILETGLSNGVGAKLWGAALTMSQMLCREPDLVRGKDVLELGSGVGLCGLLASKLGAAHVTLTDFEESLLDALDRSVEANDVTNASVCALDWTKELIYEDTQTPNPNHALLTDATFDVLIGSDVLYEPQHVAALPACVARRMKRDGYCILINATRYASMFDDLLAACEKTNLRVDRIELAHAPKRKSWHADAERALRLTRIV